MMAIVHVIRISQSKDKLTDRCAWQIVCFYDRTK